MVSLSWYLGVGALLFAISVVGIFLNRKNLIVLLMAIELMLLAVNINFVAFSHYFGDHYQGIRVLHSDGGCRRGCDRAGDSGRAVPQLVDDRRARTGLKGLTTMRGLYLLVPLAPLIGALVAGLGGKVVGRTGAHVVTISAC